MICSGGGGAGGGYYDWLIRVAVFAYLGMGSLAPSCRAVISLSLPLLACERANGICQPHYPLASVIPPSFLPLLRYTNPHQIARAQCNVLVLAGSNWDEWPGLLGYTQLSPTPSTRLRGNGRRGRRRRRRRGTVIRHSRWGIAVWASIQSILNKSSRFHSLLLPLTGAHHSPPMRQDPNPGVR